MDCVVRASEYWSFDRRVEGRANVRVRHLCCAMYSSFLLVLEKAR